MYSPGKENAAIQIPNIYHVIYVSQIQEASNVAQNIKIIHLVINVNLVQEV